MAKKQHEGGIQIGTSSLVLIFVVLALTVFAVLSLTSALADDRLTDRTESWVLSYYAADACAEGRMAEIDRIAEEAVASGDFVGHLTSCLPDTYDPATGKVSFSVNVNDELELDVEAKITAETTNGRHYQISKWQEVNTREYNIDDSMPVWSGNFESMER